MIIIIIIIIMRLIDALQRQLGLFHSAGYCRSDR